ncbi:hypothetical protein EUGRSUZ_F04349 [Eucalyptus grandis]|uniref:Uncharacterized protein n=2 Tax=Eucalyptus grandis TaxID=71139 RepID=A0ACC3KPM1_EUCGR|nr:hypothetical protein EUGRSUZ_F04349 [Eucalyptus grandis]
MQEQKRLKKRVPLTGINNDPERSVGGQLTNRIKKPPENDGAGSDVSYKIMQSAPPNKIKNSATARTPL